MNKKIHMYVDWVGSLIFLVIGVSIISQCFWSDLTFKQMFLSCLLAFLWIVFSVRLGFMALMLYLNTEGDNDLDKVSIRDIDLK
jgi:ABC-type dipeptide/oligopeptide/nickel transport system permease component